MRSSFHAPAFKRASDQPAANQPGTQHGSVNWAFIITLFLLLGFIFMWFTAADERDKVKGEKEKLTLSLKDVQAQALAAGAKLAEVSSYTGWVSQTMTVGSESIRYTDVEKLKGHLADNGEVDVKDASGNVTKVPGLYNVLRNKLVVEIMSAMRTGESTAVSKDGVKEISFAWATDKFKAKLREVDGLQKATPPKPVQPLDEGDQAAQEKYRQDLEAFEKAVMAFRKGMDELTGPEFAAEWKQWAAKIGGAMTLNPDTAKGVTLNFSPDIVARPTTIEELLPYMPQVFEKVAKEFQVNKEADWKVIAKLNADVAAGLKSIEDGKKQVEDVRTQLSDELGKKTTALEASEKRAAENEQAARKAEQVLVQATDDNKKAVARLSAEKNALQQAVNSNKEKRDLSIRRDEKDGTLLAVSNQLGTGTIDLGASDKVFEGLKFNVSYVDRGGARVTVGEVQIIKVTGAHSSQVRLLNPLTTLTSGLIISNPFFDANKTLHVYCVGWAPDVLQRRMLEKMNVVVDAQPSGATDYFVVPDDWASGAKPAAEGEAAAPAADPLDKAKQEAFTFGADVVTRRMLESFLRL